MSLTIAMLLGQPIQLPTGKKRPPHYIDRPSQRTPFEEGAYRNNTRQRETNIARVLAAIAAGTDTVPTLSERLNLSRATVLKAINHLKERGQIECTKGKNVSGGRLFHWSLTK